MTSLDTLVVGDLFLADPIQISEKTVKANSDLWPDIDSIRVTHHEDGVISEPFIAQALEVSKSVVRAEKVIPDGARMVLPGDEIAITVDTIASDEKFLADVSAATNIDQVYPLENHRFGASLQVRILQISGAVAYADVLTVREQGVTVGDRVDVLVERGSSRAEFATNNLASFTCRLDREPTAGGPGVARIKRCFNQGLECELEEVEYRLEVGDRYEMSVKRGDTHAHPKWEDAVGVPTVALEGQAAASTTVVIELMEVKESVTGRVVEYHELPDIGSSHQVSLDRGQEVVILEGVPVNLDAESKVSGQGTIKITDGDVPRNGRITEYHNLPEVGTKATVMLDYGQEFVLLNGVPIELETASAINGEVTIEVSGDGLPFMGRIIEYQRLPDTGEIIECKVSRGSSEVIQEGIPIRFSPDSLVGGLEIRLKVVDEGPPVDAELIDYTAVQEGSTVRASIDSDDLSVSHAEKGNYSIDLVERAEQEGDVRVRLVTVTPETIVGEIDAYLSLGSNGQNFDRDSKSPFRPGRAKNDEITGKKL